MQQSDNTSRNEDANNTAEPVMDTIGHRPTGPNAGNNPTQCSAKIAKKDAGTQGYQDTIIYAMTWLFRIVLGGTFIFSGVVKAIDPWGTIYKMHDYIMAMPEGFMHWALPLLTVSAFVLFSAETLLGAAIITGSYRRLSAFGSALMMLVMLPLTLWIALKDPVPDCGCFGDALILTNWQTFWKNVALAIMAVWLLVFNRRARCLIIPTLQWLMMTGTVAFSVCVGFIGYSIQPMLDFRPYPAGGTLIDADTWTTNAGAENMMAIWQRGDEQITIPADSIPKDDEWTFVDRIASNKAVPPGAANKKKPVKGLAIFDEAVDVTEDIIVPEREQVVVFMTNLTNLSSGNFYKLNSLYAYCQKHGITMVTIASATPLEIQDFIDHSLAEYPIYNAEDTAIKEVVRGNPAVVYLNEGKIVWKQALSAIPTYDFLESTPNEPYALKSYAPFSDKSTFKGLCLTWALYILIIIVLSHVPMVIRYTTRKLKKNKWIKDGQVLKASALVITASLMLSSCGEDEPKPGDTAGDKTRTILVYMVATNSLNTDSSDDIKEMLQGYEASPAGCTNLLVYKADLNGDAPTLSVVHTKKDGTAYLKELKTYAGKQSSVSKARISEVMEDMKRFAPASDYGLFLWSHATAWLPPATPADTDAPGCPGPMRAFGDDYGKSISITDLAIALPKGTFSFIWMDCCLMGSIEVVYQLRDHCPIIICYPTEVLAGGAPYQDVLPHLLNQEISIEQAAQATFNYYANNPSTRYQSCTVSIIHTEWLDDLAAIARAIAHNGTMDIPTQGLQRYGKNNGTPFYDFKQTFLLIDGAASPHGQALEESLNKLVSLKLATPKFLDITINPDNFSGLSCHVPVPASNVASECYYRTLDWYKDIYL